MVLATDQSPEVQKLVDRLCIRVGGMKSDRGVLNQHLDEISEMICPRQTNFVQKTATQGDKRMSKVYDSTGIHCLNLMAAGLHGMATNPSTGWFALSIADKTLAKRDDVKAWLAETTSIMRANMYSPGTGITTALNEVYSDLGGFGTSVMFTGTRDDGGLLYQTRPLSETYISENHEGRVDTVARVWMEKVRNVVAMWPTMCSDAVKKKAEGKNPDERVEICHIVEPRVGYDPSKLDGKNLPYRSCYFEINAKVLLKEDGFHEFPYSAPRWNKAPGEDYGRSPGMDALPDVKMLQEMMKTTIKAAQKIADPPLLIPNDSTVGPVRTIPGGFIYYNGEEKISPLMTNANVPLALDMIENLRNRIRTTFYVDVMQFVPDAQGRMTATEVLSRNQERLRLLGPVVGRLEGELIGSFIYRTFGILYRQKKIPPAPEALRGHDMTVQFVSPIAMAQKQTEANSLFQALGYIVPIAQMDPEMGKEILRPLKKETIWPWVAEHYNLDPVLTMTEDEMDAATAEDVKKQNAAMALAAAQPMADAANKGAGAVDKMATAAQKGADLGGLTDALGTTPAAGNA